MTGPRQPKTLADAELAARLLRAGSREAPSQKSLERTLSALGLSASAALGASAVAASTTNASAATASATTASGATVSKVAGTMSAVALMKVAGLGALAGVVAAGSAYELSRPSERAAAVSKPSLPALHTAHRAGAHSATRSVAQPGAPPLSERGEASAPADAMTRELLRERALVRDTTRVPHAKALAAEPLETAPELAAEIAFVDRGRVSFQSGAFRETLSALEAYERTFPARRLLPEVLYLRMQAYDGSGDERRALEAATHFLREFPRSPHASSARARLRSSRDD
jgi:hypothetical protein